MPADFLSRNVFDAQLPNLQKEDPACKVIYDFIQSLDNPEANQEPFKSQKANSNLTKYAQECFIQDNNYYQGMMASQKQRRG